MAYTRRNLLQRMIKVQNITLEYKSKGSTQKWVYENVIKPRYDISRSTYYDYLGTNAKLQLKLLEQKEQQQKQLALF